MTAICEKCQLPFEPKSFRKPPFRFCSIQCANKVIRRKSRRISDETVREIRRLGAEGWKLAQLKNKFPEISKPHIVNILAGRYRKEA